MGTRSGDVDPGALLYLLQQGKMSPQDLSDDLNKRSGLLGVSGSSEDMRDLLDKSPSDRTPPKPSSFSAIAPRNISVLRRGSRRP